MCNSVCYVRVIDIVERVTTKRLCRKSAQPCIVDVLGVVFDVISPKYFSEVIKRETGMTPTQFRER